MSYSVLNSSNLQGFLDSFDNFVFDCDGVLWIAHDLLPRVAETLELLTKLGKKIFFVTNNSTSSREQYVKKLKEFGIVAKKDEVYCSAYGAASYLESLGFNKKAYVIGEDGIVAELKEVGITALGGPAHSGVFEWTDCNNLVIDHEVGAVIVGLDRKTNYYKNCYAHLCLARSDCMFLATNLDSTFPASYGKVLPGGGTMVQALVTSTGRTPTVIGKPERWLLDVLIDKHGLDRSRTIMIGDRLDTDIAFGHAGDMKSLLVLTGVSTLEHVLAPNNTIIPDFVVASVGDIYDCYEKIRS